MRVLLLKGGPDAEREVSLRSGGMVAAALRDAGLEVEERVIERPDADELRAMPGDVIFPVLHGPFGEGGPLQELLEADGRPYVGSRPRSARLAMDKLATKTLARRLGIPTPPSREIRAVDRNGAGGAVDPLGSARAPGALDQIDMKPPVVIKPIDDGSTVDVFICRTRSEVDEALEAVFGAASGAAPKANGAAPSARAPRRRDRVMAERFIEGREITVGWLLGRPLPLIEIVPAEGFYDYDAKYLRDDTEYVLEPERPESWAGSRAGRKPLDPRVAALARDASEALVRGIGARHVARVDFMVDADGPWLLEINTMPGFTDHSLVPKAAAHAGIPFPQLCRSLVEAAAVETASSPSVTNGRSQARC